MPEPLDAALADLRPMLLDADTLVRAVAAGRRRGHTPQHERAELRPVDLKAGRRLQVVTTDGRTPITRNHVPGPDAEAAVDALLAEPFGNWHVETAERVVQLRVTKKGEAQVHATATSRRQVVPRSGGAEPLAHDRSGALAHDRSGALAHDRSGALAHDRSGALAHDRSGALAHDRAKERLLDPGDPLFDALGADADKRRQVDAFLRQLAPVVARARAVADAQGRPLHVVDLGCGNAYLTFAAHRYLTTALAVRTVGVDLRPEMAERNTALAVRLGMAGGDDGSGLTFVAGAIEDADPGLGAVDVVLALHACDTATDDALARAVRWQATAVLAAPCCHHDVQRQLAVNLAAGTPPPHPYGAVTRHGILRERLADVLTDALRADVLRLLGYRVDVVEFVDSRHTPRNALLRAERTGAPPDDARRRELADLRREWNVEPALARLLADELVP